MQLTITFTNVRVPPPVGRWLYDNRYQSHFVNDMIICIFICGSNIHHVKSMVLHTITGIATLPGTLNARYLPAHVDILPFRLLPFSGHRDDQQGLIAPWICIDSRIMTTYTVCLLVIMLLVTNEPVPIVSINNLRKWWYFTRTRSQSLRSMGGRNDDAGFDPHQGSLTTIAKSSLEMALQGDHGSCGILSRMAYVSC